MRKNVIKIAFLVIGLCLAFNSFAKVQWLPDHEETTSSRTFNGTINNGNSKTCTDYTGVFLSIPENQKCAKFSLRPGVTCYRNCQCKDGYRKSGDECVCAVVF